MKKIKEVIRTPLAKKDLKSIWHYIALDNPKKADDFLFFLEKRIFHIATFPESGVLREDILKKLHILSCKGYNILYLLEDQSVLIVRVLQGNRDVSKLMKNLG